MSLLLESVYLKDGEFRNLAYHEVRMKKSSLHLFKNEIHIELSNLLAGMKIPSRGLFKTRIMYDTQIHQIEFVPYVINPVRSLKLVQSNTITYDHKFQDRSLLHQLYEQRKDADDILIVKNEFITDTYYANIIFKKDDIWYTPRHYLLKGTMRQYLLETEEIKEAEITIDSFRQYESCKLINAMLGMDGEEISMESIT